MKSIGVRWHLCFDVCSLVEFLVRLRYEWWSVDSAVAESLEDVGSIDLFFNHSSRIGEGMVDYLSEFR